MYSFEQRSPYSFNTDYLLQQSHGKWQRNRCGEEAISRYIRLKTYAVFDPQEVLANVLFTGGELQLGKDEAEVGIKMSDYAGLNSPQSWWVKVKLKDI